MRVRLDGMQNENHPRPFRQPADGLFEIHYVLDTEFWTVTFAVDAGSWDDYEAMFETAGELFQVTGVEAP